MDSVSAYSFASLAWLSTQAVPLIVWPSFISSMLAEGYHHNGAVVTPINAVEQYFARSLGFSQLAVGLLLVVLSGALPLTSLTETPANTVSPYADAVILVSMLYHASSAFYAYTRFNGTNGQVGYLLGTLGSSLLAVFALWIMLFGSTKGHISKRTGADKRTSGFPFKNREADKRLGGKDL
ncbi:hypothetical protein B0T17DRAFT_537355 [Bombardia bombarda]|uniref:Uncharacterized protein n=1 Tax=Bombardia bombarda TaxID=252184 RepID=A0AA39WN12_9PEZI|nr:hypothetical protein B0T17DRAFT_537355 [Bombardia bombarda]